MIKMFIIDNTNIVLLTAIIPVMHTQNYFSGFTLLLKCSVSSVINALIIAL